MNTIESIGGLGMKTCTKCGVPKELSGFHKRKDRKGSYYSQCKSCGKEYRESNKERIAERDRKHREATGYDRKYYQANKERIAEKCKKWYEANTEKSRKYREANKGRIAEKDKRYQESNKERISEQSKKYYEANKERCAKVCRKWQKTNPDKMRSIYARRRSVKLNASPPWIASADNAQIQEFYTLAKIQSETTGKQYHVDHIHPLSHPLICGLHVPANLQILEASVNISKKNKFKPYIESECDFTELWQVRSGDRIPIHNPKAAPQGQLTLF